MSYNITIFVGLFTPLGEWVGTIHILHEFCLFSRWNIFSCVFEYIDNETSPIETLMACTFSVLLKDSICTILIDEGLLFWKFGYHLGMIINDPYIFCFYENLLDFQKYFSDWKNKDFFYDNFALFLCISQCIKKLW